MTAFSQTPSAPPVVPLRPNYWLGFVLNFLLVGSGFTYINRIGWHFGWLAVSAALVVSVGLLATVQPVLGFVGLAVMLAATIAMQVHYRATYAHQFSAGRTGQPIRNGLKWGLIIGHVLLGLIFQVGVIAAILIPNLLAARERAQDTAANSYARVVYTGVVMAALEGKAQSGDCLRGYTTMEPTSTAAACVTDVSDPANPTLTLTLTNGKTIDLP
ncbi:hypothetical protein ACFFLM_02395 [Deinococcus oregonensis]|uniref:Uncharacterized protein n=1 Tax=Deinococcus oregonensis TaxID=1805970 RepID=A0ABV6ATS8_9DEIO